MRNSTRFLFLLIFFNSFQYFSQNLIQNGAFELGGPGNGFIVDGAGYTMLTAPFSGTTVNGNYGFGTNTILFNSTFLSGGDHTTGAGIMMMIDGNTVGGQQRFYKAGSTGGGVCGLTVGLTYTFSYWIKSISANSNTVGTRANIGIQFNNVASFQIQSGSTLAPHPNNGWQEVVYQFVPNSACVNIELFNNNVSATGNKFAIDDLTVLGPPNSLQFTYSTVQSGCGSPTNFIAIYAKGGTAPYNYQLTGAASLSNTTGNFNNLIAGTYNITVTDASNTVVTVSNVTIAPNTTSDVLTQDATICAGQSVQLATTLPVSANNWLSTPNDPSLVAVNNTTFSVTPTQTTTYSLGNGTNLIYNNSFQLGATGFSTQHQLLTTNPNVGQGVAGVTSNSQLWFNPFDSCTDQDGTNTMLVVDAATQPNVIIWRQTVPVQPNTNYTFSYWATSVVNISPAQLQVVINGTNVNTTTLTTSTCTWQNITVTWNSGAATTATIDLLNGNLASNGNDFAIDNLSFIAASDCQVTVTVTPSTQLQLNPSYTFCLGGTINLSVPNATNLVWVTPSGSSITTNNLIINNAQITQAGIYSVSVQGGGSCNLPAQTNVILSAGPTLTTNVQNVLCNGQNNGSATVNPVGNAPFTYAWSNGTNGQSITNLSPQNYSVTVTDNNSCTSTIAVNITQPGALVANITTIGSQCNQANGSASVTISGGTAPYSSTWSNGNTGTTASNLASGNHSLTIVDANNCSQTFNFTIGLLQSTLNVTANTVDAICSQANGSATVVITGGTSPFLTTWSNGNTGNTVSNLPPGNHSVTVLDANSCSITYNFSIGSQQSNLNVSANTVNAQCNLPNGSATVLITGGTAPFITTWSNGSSGNTATNLAEGNHSVTVVDANLCTQTFNFTIGSQVSTLAINVNTTGTLCNTPTGSATVVISGGNAPYTTSWSNGNSGNTATNLPVGNHSVTVVDATMCSQTMNFTINQLNGPTASATITTPISCFGDVNGAAQISVTGGFGPYSFNWIPNVSSTSSANNLSSGAYQVTVTDNAGCESLVEFTLEQPAALGVTSTVSNPTCGLTNGSIALQPVGGTGNYTFTWQPSLSTSAVVSNLAAGSYSAVVADENGCTTSFSQTLQTVGTIPIAPNSSTIVIQNGNSANLGVFVGSGITNFTVLWSPAAEVTCPTCQYTQANPTENTTYIATVTTPDGCVASTSVNVVVETPCGELFLPTIFSPNVDDLNDYYCVLGSCLESIEFSIYNRWGELVFYTNDQNRCWDGSFRGKEAPVGVYAYKFSSTDSAGKLTILSGNISLVR